LLNTRTLKRINERPSKAKLFPLAGAGAGAAALGVEEGASMRKIVAAYRKLARTYHPDKVLELPAEARKISERRMKEINAAYSELKRQAETPRGSGGSYSPADSIYRSS
jgi:DnaJ-domain-containing protein 1